MVSGQIITFLVVVLCGPGECVQGHVPLADVSLAQCFADDPRIPADALERWQIYVKGEPQYVPVLAWCERGKKRTAYRRRCFEPGTVARNADPWEAIRETAHRCVGRSVLDDPEPGSSVRSAQIERGALAKRN